MFDPRDNYNKSSGGMMDSPAWRSGLEYAGWLYQNNPEYRARIDRETQERKEVKEQELKQESVNTSPVYSKHIEGYPTLIVWDGCVYCVECCNGFAQIENEDVDITEDERIFSRPDEAGITQSVNWENPDIYCDHCMDMIDCAYPSD